MVIREVGIFFRVAEFWVIASLLKQSYGTKNNGADHDANDGSHKRT